LRNVGVAVTGSGKDTKGILYLGKNLERLVLIGEETHQALSFISEQTQKKKKKKKGHVKEGGAAKGDLAEGVWGEQSGKKYNPLQTWGGWGKKKVRWAKKKDQRKKRERF